LKAILKMRSAGPFPVVSVSRQMNMSCLDFPYINRFKIQYAAYRLCMNFYRIRNRSLV
jgi:hypothetical protein